VLDPEFEGRSNTTEVAVSRANVDSVSAKKPPKPVRLTSRNKAAQPT
jgi:hypothetical protein